MTTEIQDVSGPSPRLDETGETDEVAARARLGKLLDQLAPYQTREPERQLRLAEEALALAEALGLDRERARALAAKGRAHALLLAYEAALPSLLEAAAFFERQEGDEAGDERRRLRGLLASIHATIGNYEEALVLALDNLEAARQHGQREDEAWHLHGLSGAYLELGDTARALDHAMEALGVFTELGHPTGQARAHSAVGTALRALGRYDEAAAHHEVSLQLFREADDPLGESRALFDLGAVAHEQGDFERALDVHRRALDLRRRLNNPQAQSTSLRAMGETLLAMGRTDEALAALHEALDLADDLALRPRLFLVHRALSDAYEAAGDPAKALHHYRCFHRVREAVLDAQTSGRLQTLQIRHDAERAQQEAEIERLRSTELREKNEQLERLLAELQATQARLVQSEKLAGLGRLTAGIAHEIKNPLNFVANFSQLNAELAENLRAVARSRRADLPDDLARELTDGLDTVAANGERVLAHARRADGIVKSMLGHVRSTGGERRAVGVHALLDGSIEHVFGGHDGGGGVTVERAYDPEVGAIEAVPQSMQRVFVNLLENARYAVARGTTDGGPPRVTVRTRALPGLVQVRVVDNGPGIPAAHCTRLFEPFFTTKPPGEGTGLGLSLSYDIVTQGHGGSMAAISREGQGATFVVTLPASSRGEKLFDEGA